MLDCWSFYCLFFWDCFLVACVFICDFMIVYAVDVHWTAICRDKNSGPLSDIKKEEFPSTFGCISSVRQNAQTKLKKTNDLCLCIWGKWNSSKYNACWKMIVNFPGSEIFEAFWCAGFLLSYLSCSYEFELHYVTEAVVWSFYQLGKTIKFHDFKTL